MMRQLLVALFVLTVAGPLWAQEDTYKLPPIITLPPGADNIVPLLKSGKAPFSGQLFDTNTALRWGFWLQQYKLRLKSDVGVVRSLCTAEITYKDKALGIEQVRARAVEKDLDARLLRSEKARLAAEEYARNPPWYNTRTFGAVIGVVATVGVVALSVWALEARSAN
jgi:hypothetical protein